MLWGGNLKAMVAIVVLGVKLVSDFIRAKSTTISHLIVTFKKILGKNQLTTFVVDYDKINYRD